MRRDAAEILFAVVAGGAVGGGFGLVSGVAVGVGLGLATWGYANVVSCMRSRGQGAVSSLAADAPVSTRGRSSTSRAQSTCSAAATC
ncbi:MAG: hypothetical protein JWP87_660 [Labilithrix sp.]|nr:hypothetical protein [Labilithrix sp.]